MPPSSDSPRPLAELLLTMLLLADVVGCASAPAINRALYTVYQAPNQAESAWRIIERELRRPRETIPRAEFCEIRSGAMLTIARNMSHPWIPKDPDQLIERSLDEIEEHCVGTREEYLGYSWSGYWYFHTNRPARALPYMQKELAAASNDHQRCIALSNIASAHRVLGNHSLRDAYRSEAIATCRSYFDSARQYRFANMESQDWIAFSDVLAAQSVDIVESGRTEGLAAIWDERWSILRRWGTFDGQQLGLYGAAQVFARVGNEPRLRSACDDLGRYVESASRSTRYLVELNRLPCLAELELASGRADSGAKIYAHWIADWDRQLDTRGFEPQNFGFAARAQEQAGRFGKAIELYTRGVELHQNQRSAWGVNERARVFDTTVIELYWGLLRSYARRYLRDKDPDDLERAIEVGRLSRARQLGELLSVADESLDQLRSRLRPDEIVVDLHTTDRAIVTFAITATGTDVSITPTPVAELSSLTRRARAGILRGSGASDLKRSLERLSRDVFGRVAPTVRQARHIVFLPDGPLASVPIALLSAETSHYSPLVETHTTSYASSLSLLAAHRSRGRSRFDTSTRLFALADPRYGDLISAEAPDATSRAAIRRSADEYSLLVPLPETRHEVERASQLIASEERTTFLTGEHATESEIKSLPLIEYDVLHFATHGLLGGSLPGVGEPALVLAGGDESSDGLLSLSEIQAIELDSQLTVLSACDTAAGEFVRGEGVMGLARGFLEAGSRAVVASLWPVSSEATVAFMESFYSSLADGARLREAMRIARLELRARYRPSRRLDERGLAIAGAASDESSTAFYWAPFVLIGSDS